jgi:hypothetical protein
LSGAGTRRSAGAGHRDSPGNVGDSFVDESMVSGQDVRLRSDW